MEPNTLNIFLAVVFITSPTVFRIVRGLTLDIKTRDYVAAAQTRGERPWYIMMWEILPNARGPLIVDFCLRIGYTTILLGTLGFFGLGVSPESPGLGLDDQRGPQAPARLHPPRPAPGARHHEPGARPEPARRRAARAIDAGLTSRMAPRLRNGFMPDIPENRRTRSNMRAPDRNRRAQRRPPPAASSRSRTSRSPSSPAPREIPAVMNFSATVAPGEALGLVGEFGLRQVHRGARRSCATSARTAASSAARSASRAATSPPCPTPSCARSAAPRSR